MIKYSNLKVGEVLSETSYYVVKKLMTISGNDSNGNRINQEVAVLTDSHGNELTIGKEYVEKVLASADQFTSTEEHNQTEVINIVKTNPRVACSIYFRKQDVLKTKKVFNAEKAAKIAEIQNAKVSDVEKLLSDLIDNPILPTTPGEMRLMKGYYTGTQDERGRLLFVDMEDKGIVKGVDPRTIVYAIVNNIKYVVK